MINNHPDKRGEEAELDIQVLLAVQHGATEHPSEDKALPVLVDDGDIGEGKAQCPDVAGHDPVGHSGVPDVLRANGALQRDEE